MRPAPGPIPAKMPELARAARNIQYQLDMRRERLGGVDLSTLILDFSDGEAVWLTGSTVWLPAVFDVCPMWDDDLDIVFSNQAAADRFVRGALAVLNVGQRKPYTLERNKKGGARIVHPDGRHVMDVWSLEPFESIYELLLAYPDVGDHIRCAYYVSASPSAGCLFRLIGSQKRRAQLENVRNASKLAQISQMLADSGYPGGSTIEDTNPPEIGAKLRELPPQIYSNPSADVGAAPPGIALPIKLAGLEGLIAGYEIREK